MPVSLTQINANVSTVTFSVGEATVTVTYYPGKVTEKTIAAMQLVKSDTVDDAMKGFEAFNTMLASLIKTWDVYEDDAETVMFPIDAERFQELPFPFRTQVLQAIMDDIRPNQTAP